jgi:hypothetical protein
MNSIVFIAVHLLLTSTSVAHSAVLSSMASRWSVAVRASCPAPVSIGVLALIYSLRGNLNVNNSLRAHLVSGRAAYGTPWAVFSDGTLPIRLWCDLVTFSKARQHRALVDASRLVFVNASTDNVNSYRPTGCGSLSERVDVLDH